MILLCELQVWDQVGGLPPIGSVEIAVSAYCPGLHHIERGVNFCPSRIGRAIARQTAPTGWHPADHSDMSLLFEPQDDLESKHGIDYVVSVIEKIGRAHV